jgi:hypothetical protein
MRCCLPVTSSVSAKRRFWVRRWLRNDDGAAAIEFAIVALPFFMFVFGILGIGLYFLASSSLEYGVEAAARKVRTGQAQKGAVTVGQFKQDVCDAAGSYIDCSKLSVIVQHASSWSGITPQACLDSRGNMVGSTGGAGDLMSTYTGTASEVVLVTLCYQWDLATTFGFMNLGKNSDGSGPAVVQASTAFRSEPYL